MLIEWAFSCGDRLRAACCKLQELQEHQSVQSLSHRVAPALAQAGHPLDTAAVVQVAARLQLVPGPPAGQKVSYAGDTPLFELLLRCPLIVERAVCPPAAVASVVAGKLRVAVPEGAQAEGNAAALGRPLAVGLQLGAGCERDAAARIGNGAEPQEAAAAAGGGSVGSLPARRPAAERPSAALLRR